MTETPDPTPRPSRRIRRRASHGAGGLAIFGALTILAAIVIVPILATVLGGFKTLGDCASTCSVCRVNGRGTITGRSWRASAIGARSAIRC